MADGGNFTTTRWSMVLAVGQGASLEKRDALAKLCKLYWSPVYAFIRRRGYNADVSLDLTQGFFAHVIEKNPVRHADPERGRFRSFLLAMVKAYLSNENERTRAQKRGGGQPVISLDRESVERLYSMDLPQFESPDAAFERRWTLALLEHVLERLEQERKAGGHLERFLRFRPFLTGEGTGGNYKALARELGMTESGVKVAIHRLRKRYGQLLREEVAQTLDDPSRVDEEIRQLFAALET